MNTDFELESPVPSKRGKAFSHDRVEDTKHEWLTPPALIKALGEFDLDPCAPTPETRPWATAKTHFDISNNGLTQPWHGRVWLNPPYENKIAGQFLARMVEHGNGVVLIYARTETANFFEYVWPKADALLFLKGRLTFCHVDGTPASNGGGGTFRAYRLRCGERARTETRRTRRLLRSAQGGGGSLK